MRRKGDIEADEEPADLLQRWQDKVCTEPYRPLFATRLRRKLDVHQRSEEEKRHRAKDKAERATVESVLDPRTKIVLFKLLAQGVLKSISGCISTGKEANVYHAVGADEEIAVKVYQTSILTFKDRDRYMAGDYRLRHGYSRHNNRKLVKMWALKEYRNLCRLHKSPVLCPKPIACRSNVVVMSLIGHDGLPSPQLKEVELSAEQARKLYIQVCIFMRYMYHVCKLVHADLSEYNLIYHDGSAYIIDVSQSVETDHPGALQYLYRDCLTMTKFFCGFGLSLLPSDRLVAYVVDSAVSVRPDSEEKNFIELLKKEGSLTNCVVDEGQAGIVYQTMLVERRMRESLDVTVERITQQLPDSDEQDSEYTSEDVDSEETDSLSESSSASDEEVVEPVERRNRKEAVSLNLRQRAETAEEKKARKLAVKLEKRENRSNKVPKHVKKRRKKLAKTNAKRK